jgi:hypothetical protein
VAWPHGRLPRGEPSRQDGHRAADRRRVGCDGCRLDRGGPGRRRPGLRCAVRRAWYWAHDPHDGPPNMKVSKRKVFGPVLTVAPYRTWADGIRLPRTITPYGLQAGVFHPRMLGGFERRFEGSRWAASS